MFEVLAFVYENYAGEAFKLQPVHWERKLSAVGFESDEIQDAVRWISALSSASQIPAGMIHWQRHASTDCMRVYSGFEYRQLGSRAIGLLCFLESCKVITAYMREVIVDRALVAAAAPMALADFKIIVLMVLWSFGREPDALILDELCDPPESRWAH